MNQEKQLRKQEQMEKNGKNEIKEPVFCLQREEANTQLKKNSRIWVLILLNKEKRQIDQNLRNPARESVEQLLLLLKKDVQKPETPQAEAGKILRNSPSTALYVTSRKKTSSKINKRSYEQTFHSLSLEYPTNYRRPTFLILPSFHTISKSFEYLFVGDSFSITLVVYGK